VPDAVHDRRLTRTWPGFMCAVGRAAESGRLCRYASRICREVTVTPVRSTHRCPSGDTTRVASCAPIRGGQSGHDDAVGQPGLRLGGGVTGGHDNGIAVEPRVRSVMGWHTGCRCAGRQPVCQRAGTDPPPAAGVSAGSRCQRARANPPPAAGASADNRCANGPEPTRHRHQPATERDCGRPRHVRIQ
jgi:hypothetical protein